MDIPHSSTTPSIRIYDFNSPHEPYRSPSHPSYASSHSLSAAPRPMSIPNAREAAPPALPPPQFIESLAQGEDPGWQWGNAGHDGSFGRSGSGSVHPLSSLHGGRRQRERQGASQEQAFFRGNKVEPLASPASISSSSGMGRYSEKGQGFTNPGLQGPKQLEQQTLKKSSQEYDKQLLSKIGNPNTPPRTFRPSNLGNLARPDSPNSYPQLASGNQCGQLRTHSLPDGTAVSAADNALYQWSNGSKSAAVSPGIAPSAFPPQSYMDARGSGLPSSNDSDRFSRLRNSESGWSGCSSIFSHSDDASSLTSRSNRGSYDQSTYMESDQDFPEEAAMKHLNLRDLTPPGSEGRSPSSKAGMKRRRGSSPNREPAREERSSIVSMGSVGDPYSQRSSGHLLASRDSPVLRFPPGHGSISSNSSIGARNSSYASSAGLSVAASSITSISSFDRLSPGGISPSSEMDLGHDLPYAAASSLNPSPRSSLSHARHQRTLSESKHPSEIKMSNDSLCHAKHHSAPRLQGLFICECCPKKPKRFDSQEEKALHEMEKQYTCQYCHNRFKNKNEAERHQNSLHLRRHSWSCAALSGVDAAFHPSSSNPAAADVCGYCGDEFAAPANWDVRVEHLTSVHKFGECNQSKKFFRADHFRQHLKHSHAGTSGKWTNMLENACMKDEPPPERINSGGEGKRRGSGGDGDGGGGGGILAPPGSSGGGGERGGDVRGHVIDEVHEES